MIRRMTMLGRQGTAGREAAAARRNRRWAWIRRPVRREGAERYLLATLVSFAATVIGTRWFLELTGFPQIGGGDPTQCDTFNADL